MASENDTGRIFLDTNIVIAFINGELSTFRRIVRSSWVGISVITWLEFLAYRNLPDASREVFKGFVSNCNMVDLRREDSKLLETIIEVRSRFGLKLPDAIIAASAKVNQATLITKDPNFNRLIESNFLAVENI